MEKITTLCTSAKFRTAISKGISSGLILFSMFMMILASGCNAERTTPVATDGRQHSRSQYENSKLAKHYNSVQYKNHRTEASIVK
jgi:hypothetical protein